ncbi:transposase [Ferrovum myxofaciens]|uniref:transposase n=1 Tax=Ferrovum myxofaciens TaxID=416213 RepID=UPI00235667D4|nr:transposase [Ferrovum myxofaciens]MBU6995394.1 transposase [Ferrovum myxofaciens]
MLGHHRGAILELGARVRAVWCEMRRIPLTRVARPRLILATETELSAQAVVEIYAERWGIEPLFHNLKRWWGVTNPGNNRKGALEPDADSFHSLALDPIARPETVELFPLRKSRPAQGSNDHGGTSVSGCIHLFDFPYAMPSPVRTATTPKSWNFCDAFPIQDQRDCSAEARNPCPSLNESPQPVFSPPHHHGKPWVAGRGECLKFSYLKHDRPNSSV